MQLQQQRQQQQQPQRQPQNRLLQYPPNPTLPRVRIPRALRLRNNGEEHIIDFYRFAKYILGYNKLGEEHRLWAHELERVVNIQKLHKVVLLKPRGTYKTTFYTVSLPLWLHLENPDLRILITNAVETNARNFLTEITGHYLRNERLADIYRKLGYPGCPVDPHGALSTTLRLTNCTKIQKEPNIATLGYGSTAVSQHYDIIIVDDLVDRKDRESPTEREAKKRWFADLASLLEPDGLLLMVGTRWHWADCYDYIIRELNPKHAPQDKYHVEVESCYITDAGRKIARYPRILSMAKLEELKIDKGLAEFAANYENNPLPEETQLFREHELSFFSIGQLGFRGDLTYYGFCDPALGKKKSDFSVIITIGVDKFGIIYVLDAIVKVMKPNDTKEMILQRASVYPYSRFGIEDNGFQDLFMGEVKAEGVKRQLYVPVEGVHHSTNKGGRIESLQPLTYKSEIRPAIIQFRQDWLEVYPELMEQLLKYPVAAHDDAPDALEGAVSLAKLAPPEPDEDDVFIESGGSF